MQIPVTDRTSVRTVGSSIISVKYVYSIPSGANNNHNWRVAMSISINVVSTMNPPNVITSDI
jgi:hypothetical protein